MLSWVGPFMRYTADGSTADTLGRQNRLIIVSQFNTWQWRALQWLSGSANVALRCLQSCPGT